MKRGLENGLLALFVGLFIFSILMSFSQPAQRETVVGYATQYSTVSNVSITNYLSIAMSANLSWGIIFGNVTTLPAVNVNASHNYDGGSSTTSMYVNVSTDSNTAVDLCMVANEDLFDGVVNRIAIGNETYANSSTTSSTLPLLSNEYSISKSYSRASSNVAIGGVSYFRFWLDVPAATSSGNYNNSITFKGVPTGGSC
jgi:hypothetical protein